MPCVLVLFLGAGLWKRQPVFDQFLCGAKGGLRVVAQLAPTLVGLLTAVAMFKASGAVDLLTGLLRPALELVGVPVEMTPLLVLRPVTGSGSIAILSNILQNCGPDSMVGRMASVVLASTETTFYTVAVYFGAAGVKKTGYTVPAALCADAAGFLGACFFVRLLFS